MTNLVHVEYNPTTKNGYGARGVMISINSAHDASILAFKNKIVDRLETLKDGKFRDIPDGTRALNEVGKAIEESYAE